MVRATVVTFWGREELCAELYEKYHSHIPKVFSGYRYDGGGYLALPLLPESKELEEVLEILNREEKKTTLFSRVHYTKREIENTKFFELIDPFPLELEGTNAANYGTQYEGKCPYCGFGGSRVGDVFIDRKFIRKSKLGNLFPEFFVSEEVRDVIEANHLTGISFGTPLKDHKGREMASFFSAHIENVLPPLSESTFLDFHGRSPCKVCGHQVVYLRSDLQYEPEKLAEAKDFNLTCEHLNNYNLQSIIISSRVREVFLKNGIRQCRYRPVAIV